MGFDPVSLGVMAAGGVLSSISGAKQAKAQNRAFNSVLNAPVNMPSDIEALRRNLASQLSLGLQNNTFGISDPQIQSIEALFRERMDPGFTEAFMQPFQATENLANIFAAGVPLLHQNLQRFADSAVSRFGATGNRGLGSSDFSRHLARGAGDATAQFQSNIANLLPQLLNTQLGARSFAEQLQSSAPGLLAARQGLQLGPLTAMFPFATAGVGGTNASAAANIGMSSPSGAAFGGMANTLGLVPSLPRTSDLMFQDAFRDQLIPGWNKDE